MADAAKAATATNLAQPTTTGYVDMHKVQEAIVDMQARMTVLEMRDKLDLVLRVLDEARSELAENDPSHLVAMVRDHARIAEGSLSASLSGLAKSLEVQFRVMQKKDVQ